MKNVCKKLFSLMLVAVLLVSIVPFSAMAASSWVEFWTEDDVCVGRVEWTSAEAPNWDTVKVPDGYEGLYLMNSEPAESTDGPVYYFIVKATEPAETTKPTVPEETTKPTEPEETTKPTETEPVKKYDVVLWIDGTAHTVASVEAGSNFIVDKALLTKCGVDFNKYTIKETSLLKSYTINERLELVFTTKAIEDKNDDKVTAETYTVKLKFYTNNNASAVRVVDITNSYALDNIVAWKEVQQYVKDNFVSSNSLGINIDGIYMYEGSAWANWITSGYKASDVTIPAVGERHDDITMMVMLTGYSGGKVSLKSGSSNNNADSSNPKTGDNIFVAVTFMAVSATALAGLYLYNKKRIVK